MLKMGNTSYRSIQNFLSSRFLSDVKLHISCSE